MFFCVCDMTPQSKRFARPAWITIFLDPTLQFCCRFLLALVSPVTHLQLFLVNNNGAVKSQTESILSDIVVFSSPVSGKLCVQLSELNPPPPK